MHWNCSGRVGNYLAFCLVVGRHVGFVAFVVRAPVALAFASTHVLPVARDYFSDEWSASSLDPKRRTFFFDSFLLVFGAIEEKIYKILFFILKTQLLFSIIAD